MYRNVCLKLFCALGSSFVYKLKVAEHLHSAWLAYVKEKGDPVLAENRELEWKFVKEELGIESDDDDDDRCPYHLIDDEEDD